MSARESIELAGLLDDLATRLGAGAVLTSDEDTAAYTTDWRRMFVGRPAAVVRPATTADVALTMRLCHAAGVTVVPQGGNTGLAGGATPDASGEQIVLSLGRMKAVRTVDRLGSTMSVEAGCVLEVAQEAALAVGRVLPISFAAEGSATIGGVISTNAGGINVLRHGMARSMVLGLEAVLADGSVIDAMRALRKDNAGYDLKQLFIGSEGTLGIVTAAVLRLAPQMTSTETALLSIDRVDDALAVFAIAQDHLGDAIQAFELISRESLELVARHADLRSPLPSSAWSLLVEAGTCLPGLRDGVETFLAECLEKEHATDAVIASSQRQVENLWALRERITECEAAEGPSIKHDVSVPIGDIPAFLKAAILALADLTPAAKVNIFGHVGDGNIHFNVLADPDVETKAVNRCVHAVIERFSGSISAEHGIGQYRVAELIQTRPIDEIVLAQRIKAALDPGNRLNPGKVLPAAGSHLVGSPP